MLSNENFLWILLAAFQIEIGEKNINTQLSQYADLSEFTSDNLNI